METRAGNIRRLLVLSAGALDGTREAQFAVRRRAPLETRARGEAA